MALTPTNDFLKTQQKKTANLLEHAPASKMREDRK